MIQLQMIDKTKSIAQQDENVSAICAPDQSGVGTHRVSG